MTLGAAPYVEPKFQHYFRHNAFFVGSNVREAVAERRADYTPVFLSEIPALFKRRCFHLDVALIQVTPPDAHGFCSLGVSVDIVKPATESADIVIAQVNPRMPWTLGVGVHFTLFRRRASTIVSSLACRLCLTLGFSASR